GLGDVIRVGAHSVTEQFGINLGAAFFGVLQLFQQQNAGALADHKAVAVFIERAAGSFRIVVAGGEGAHGGKSADAHGRDRGFAAAGDHDVGSVAGDDLHGIAEGMGAGGEGGGGCLVGTFGIPA